MNLAETSYLTPGVTPLYARWSAPPPHSYSLALTDLADFSQNGGPRTHIPDVHREKLDVSSRFGRRLRVLRLERNLTQSEMARKFGIDRSFISDVERGRKSISLPLLEVIALGLQISLSALFEGL